MRSRASREGSCRLSRGLRRFALWGVGLAMVSALGLLAALVIAARFAFARRCAS